MYIIFLAYWIFKGGMYLASHVFCYCCTKKSILYEHKYIYSMFDFFLMQNLSQIIKLSKKCNIFLLDCANFVSRNGWQIKTKDIKEIFIVLKIVFCCYNCLDLPWEFFFQVWVTCFPSSWEQEQCWEKVVQVRGQRPRICDLFKTLFLLERTGKTSNEH